MHDALFAAAARPARFTILGLPMKPYSIGHEILLLEQGNALLFSNFDSLAEAQQNFSVRRAALICCQGWLDNQKPHRWLRLWQWKTRKTDFAQAIAKFKDYRQQGSAFPPVPDKRAEQIASEMRGENNRKGRELGSPYLARLYNFIVCLPESEIRVHGETAYDFPMALGNFLYLTSLEFSGDMKIENPQEAEIKSEIMQHQVDAAKEKEAEKCPR